MGTLALLSLLPIHLIYFHLWFCFFIGIRWFDSFFCRWDWSGPPPLLSSGLYHSSHFYLSARDAHPWVTWFGTLKLKWRKVGKKSTARSIWKQCLLIGWHAAFCASTTTHETKTKNHQLNYSRMNLTGCHHWVSLVDISKTWRKSGPSSADCQDDRFHY